MEVALNSSVVTTKTSTTSLNGFLPAQSTTATQGALLHVNGSYTVGGFKNDSGTTSSNSLALLAALTLNRQQQVGFMSSETSLASSATSNRNVFAFTSAGLAAVASSNKTTTQSTSATITSSSNSNTSSSSTVVTTHQSTNINNSNASSSIKNKTSNKIMKSASATITTSTTNCNSTNSNNSATAASTTTNVSKNYFQIPSDILDDLASRFIINVPDMELSNLIRICFQIELAHWFYLDFFCAIEEKKLQQCGMKVFAMQIFQHIPFLREHLSSIDKILDDWKNYKLSVPTYGAILISEDLNYCLLVQSYFAKCSWGFPKGKVNENEDPVHCATREVYEETGYDITKLIVPNDYIEAVINYQYTRLYIVRNVSLQTQFSPRTRNEIKCCDWFPIDSLPINKNDAISKAKLGINANSFFMIMPFVKRLKKWVNDKRSGIETRRKFSGGGGSGAGGQSNITPTPSSTSPVTTTIVGGPNQKNSNNSCKKSNKQQLQQYNDDNNALNNGTGVGAGVGGSNRSKRQRHKSMGDLDGIKLSNLSNNTTNSNCKTTNLKNNNGGTKLSTDHSSTNGCNVVGNGVNGCGSNANGGSNHKRILTKGSAAGGNVNGPINVSGGAPKRQLFHSQSQNGAQNEEKIVSSFDLIRKEKQQMKAAAEAEKSAKAQKQQLQQMHGGNGRVRAKSQSEKISTQQQQQQQQNSNKIISNNNNVATNNKNKQRLQKQQSMIITNSNANSSTIINNNNRVTNSGQFTQPPISGTGLITVATSAAAATPLTQMNNSVVMSTQTRMPDTSKPRPASVSLQYAPSSSSVPPQQELLLQRMASGTNLRILKRTNSHQPQQLQQQQQQQQPLKFNPSFNSWTNFSFTKNFIANVFC